jgi:hypothetical protein
LHHTLYKPNSSEANYINIHILNVFKYIFNSFYRKLPSVVDQCNNKDIEAYNPIYFTNSYRLVTFYINMLMPKLFKHVNCPTNV